MNEHIDATFLRANPIGEQSRYVFVPDIHSSFKVCHNVCIVFAHHFVSRSFEIFTGSIDDGNITFAMIPEMGQRLNQS